MHPQLCNLARCMLTRVIVLRDWQLGPWVAATDDQGQPHIGEHRLTKLAAMHVPGSASACALHMQCSITGVVWYALDSYVKLASSKVECRSESGNSTLVLGIGH